MVDPKCLLKLTLLAAIVQLVVPLSAGAAGEVEEVSVVNLPKVQEISGSIEIGKPAPATTLAYISESVVAPVDPSDTRNLLLAGTLDARGFRSATLSLAGQIKSDYPGPGTVGALLMPDTQFFRQAFEENGESLLSLQLEATVDTEGNAYFATSKFHQQLAFPTYRVYFFNTTDRPASIRLYAYLAN